MFQRFLKTRKITRRKYVDIHAYGVYDVRISPIETPNENQAGADARRYAMSLATISIVGNLAKSPEQFTFAGGRIKTTLLVAVNSYKTIQNKKEKRTDYYRVETWDRLADLANTYLHKGNQVAVSGKIALEKWVDREGKDRITPTVQANQLAFPPRLRPSEPDKVNSHDASVGTELDTVPLEAGTEEAEVQTAPLPPVESSGSNDAASESADDSSSDADDLNPDEDSFEDASSEDIFDGTVISRPPGKKNRSA